MKRLVVVVVTYVVVVWVRVLVGLVMARLGELRAGEDGDPLYIIFFKLL